MSTFLRFSFIFFFSFTNILCATAGEETTLGRIVVSATPEPEELRNIPANVQIIDSGEIAKSHASNLTQLLERSSAVNTLTQPGNFSRVTIRGFSAAKSIGNTFNDQVILLIDGMRSGTGNINNIPLGNVERVEILRGPASVLYGGAAVGGVINVITKKGKGDFSGKITAESGSFQRNAVQVGISGGLKEDKLGYSLTASQENAGDYRTGNDWRYKNSQYHKVSAGGTLTLRPSDKSELSAVLVSHNNYDSGSPGDVYFSTPNSKFANEYTFGALEFFRNFDNEVSLKANVYANQNVYTDDNREAFPYKSRFATTMLGAKTILGIPLPQLEHFDFGRLSFGGEYIKQEQSITGNSVSEPNSEMEIFSIFGEHKFFPHPSLAMRYGLRYDHYETQTSGNKLLAAEAGQQDFGQLTFNAGATWWFLDWLGLRAAVGSAYVPPTSMQLSGEYTSWGTTYRGNPDLEAEKSISLESGLDFEKDNLSGSIGYFHTKYTKRITLETIAAAPKVDLYVNQGEQVIAGFEGNIRFTQSVDLGTPQLEITPYANFEYLTERRNSGRNTEHRTIAYLPLYNALAGITFELKDTGSLKSISLDLNAQRFGNQRYTNLGSWERDNYNSFTLLNAKLSLSPVDNLSIYLEGRNLDDKHYGFKPEFPLAGRNFTLGVSYEF